MTLTADHASDVASRSNGARDILGVSVANLDRGEALSMVHAAVASGTHRPIAFLNAHNANVAHGDPAFRKVLASFTVLPDGIGVDLGSLILCGGKFAANLNGTDFVPALLREAPQPLTVGLFGGRPGVAEKALSGFAAIDPRHSYRVIGHGYLGEAETQTMLATLARKPVDILLVALGTPRQETFIAQRITGRHASVPMAVGALLDFVAGEVTRAPGWVRALRFEWVYRLALEPQRLWRRYLLGNPVFLARILGQRLSGTMARQRK